jgi:hypothetical protein
MIKQIKFATPMGLIKLPDEAWRIMNRSPEKQKEKAESREQTTEKINSFNRVLKAWTKLFPPASLVPTEDTIGPMINFFLETRKELKTDRLEFIYPTAEKQIIPGGSRQFQFAYRAGHWYGSRPKPDTHIIYCTIEFEELNPNSTSTGSLQESAPIELSIFPSLTGMMFGTIIGGFLGTSANGSLTAKNFSLVHWVPILLVNIILAFIAGIILMRRKDVQSFITIEDLWGGILIGFIVGYAGFEGFKKFLSTSPLSPTNST